MTKDGDFDFECCNKSFHGQRDVSKKPSNLDGILTSKHMVTASLLLQMGSHQLAVSFEVHEEMGCRSRFN